MAVDRRRMRDAVARLVDAAHRGDASISLEAALRMFPGEDEIVREEWRRASTAAEERSGTAGAPGGAAEVPEVDAGADPGDRDRARADRIGAYRILRQIGLGGMGVVHLAEDERLGRRVALKLIAPGFAESDEVRARFRREAEAAARLDHPGICTVYEAGDHEGVPFLAMRYVEGRTLAAHLAEQRERGAAPGDLGLPQRGPVAPPGTGTQGSGSWRDRRTALAATLHLVEKVARAIHVAHQAGIIHRDIKPGNVMVSPDGEPVVLDFGLARPEALLDSGLTAPGALLGTPAYLSPEQLAPRGAPIDRRCDVYALGVTLYECVTGELPFSAPTLDALYQDIMTTEPVDPRRRNADVSADLSVVIRTAMEKERGRRYQSALDFAEDLRRVREHEPILARPVGPATRLRRWTQRRPALSASLLLLFLSLVGGLAATSVQWRRADQFREAAESARDVARAEALVAASESESQDSMRALLLAVEAAKIPGSLERVAVLRRLSAAAHEVSERAILRRPGIAAIAAAGAPAGDGLAVGYSDGEVRVFGAAGEERLRLAEHRDIVSRVLYFPGGERLLTASWDGTARIWSADGRAIALLDPDGGRVLSADVSTDGELLVTGHEDGCARLWNADGTLRAELAGDDGWVTHACFSPEGHVVTASTALGIHVFDRDGRVLRTHRGHARRITGLGFLGDGRLVSVAADGRARVWETGGAPSATFDAGSEIFDLTVDGRRVAVAGEDGVRVLEVEGAEFREIASAERGHEVCRARFLPGGRGLLLGDDRGAVRLWTIDADASRRICAHHGRVEGLTLAPGGGTLISVGLDETVRVTSLRGPGLAVLGGDGQERVYSVHCSPTRSEFAAGYGDGTVRVHGFDGTTLWVLRGHTGAVVCVRYSPDGESILSGSDDKTARIWSRDGSSRAVLGGHFAAVVHVRWAPDGRRVLTACGQGGVPPRTEGEPFLRFVGDLSGPLGARVWTAEGREVASVAPEDMVNCVEFLPDGDRFVIGTRGPVVCSVDGRVLAQLPGHEGRLGAVAVSADGERIASSGPNLKVRICDVGGRVVRELRGNWYVTGALAWSREGRRLVATGPGHARASVWDEDGRMLLALGPFDDLVAYAEFSPDGQRIAAASYDATVRVWNAAGEEIAVLRGHRGPVLLARFSHDARHLVTCSLDGTARTWAVDADSLSELAARRATRAFLPDERARYAELLGVDPAVERDAKRLVDATLARLPLPEDAGRDVREDSRVAPTVRERALALLRESRVDAEILASLAWFDVRFPGGAEADHLRVLSWIDAARRSDPSVWRLPLYRGVALYRVGRCEEARREIEAHIHMVRADGGHEDASAWYFLALIALKAGDRAAYERECARIREAFEDPDRRPGEDDPHLKEFTETTGFEIPPAPPAAAAGSAAPVDTPDATRRPRPEIR